MAQTVVNVRVDEDKKRDVEEFCKSVGMNISTAVNLFFNAILRERRIPFEIASPKPSFMVDSKEELHAKFEEGYSDYLAGRIHDVDEVFTELDRKYGL